MQDNDTAQVVSLYDYCYTILDREVERVVECLIHDMPFIGCRLLDPSDLYMKHLIDVCAFSSKYAKDHRGDDLCGKLSFVLGKSYDF